jgi:endonuclease/exonuclease/phosphatase (EEP) superfamily protein YafD
MLLLLGTSLPLLLVIGGFVMPWPVRANPDAPVMRVMSYNVNSEAGGADAIVAEVDRYSPDIVFLVEHGASDAMVSLLQARYATVRAMGQFVIATRFPVTSAVDPDKLHYAGSRRSPRWIEAAIDTPLGPIMFLVVHPISPRDGLVAAWAGGLRHKIGTALGLARGTDEIVDYNSGLREMQVAGFTASAQTKSGPVVIAGDTNLPGLSYLLHRYLSEYQDGFTKSGWGFGYTFPVGKHRPWMRIDRILASDELRFVRFQVGTSASSDHRCVVADLQRAP